MRDPKYEYHELVSPYLRAILLLFYFLTQQSKWELRRSRRSFLKRWNHWHVEIELLEKKSMIIAYSSAEGKTLILAYARAIAEGIERIYHQKLYFEIDPSLPTGWGVNIIKQECRQLAWAEYFERRLFYNTELNLESGLYRIKSDRVESVYLYKQGSATGYGLNISSAIDSAKRSHMRNSSQHPERTIYFSTPKKNPIEMQMSKEFSDAIPHCFAVFHPNQGAHSKFEHFPQTDLKYSVEHLDCDSVYF